MLTVTWGVYDSPYPVYWRKKMTVQEALQNIDIVVSNVQMKRQEHAALQQSITLIAQRCKRADELEQAGKEAKKEVK